MRPLLALLVLFTACESQDAADQRQARRLCGLPPEAAVVSWKGYPSRVGFGQREGLSVSGTFRPPSAWTPASAGYRAAPWPSARTAAEAAFRLGHELDGAVALRCETAGNNVLHATRTSPCDGTARPIDVILCAVEPSGDVRVTVRSAY